jgi:ABC-type glycerol-3-phosphate transport system permease component
MATVSTDISRRSFVQRYRRKQRIGRIIIHVLLIAGGILWMYPFLWALGSSLKSPAGFLDEGLSVVPKEWQWSNYVTAWNDASFGQYFINTVIVTVLTVAFTLLFTSMAGYALARTRFPGKGVLLVVVAITFFLPSGYTIIPVFDLIQRLGMLNSLWAIILVQTAGNMVFSTFLFMGYFTTMDRELEDAARVDGVNFNQLFWYIMFPLARPMLATVGLFTFIGAWNNFFIPLIFTLGVPELRTLAVGLYSLISQTSTDWTSLCAGSVIALVPIIIVFAFAQRYIINAVAGAVKA